MYLKRERYLDKIRPFYEVDLIKVLTGVRRCGKSILLSQIEDEFKENGVTDDHIINVNFEKVLASVRATLNCSIFVTGSNSKLLSGKMATLLVGRCVEFRIMPFSFKEAYDYNVMIGRNITPDELIFGTDI